MTLSFSPNPVAVRESRAMWRGARSFLLLLCYTGTLALVAFLAYSGEVRSAQSYAEYASRGAGGDAFVEAQVLGAKIGRSLFVALSFVQLGAWLLIAPAISATSLSSERERGLLESLLMSYLKPRQIVAGKLAVCASFVAILIVATLPILAMCFLLGGVSPGEFGGALAIQIASAFFGLALGVWCSSGLRLSTHALGATFAALAVYLAETYIAIASSSTSASMAFIDHGLQAIGLLNPFYGMYALLEPSDSTFRFSTLSASMRWQMGAAFQVLAGIYFLVLATRRLARPLGEEEIAPQRKTDAPSTWGEGEAPPSTWGEGEAPPSTWGESKTSDGGHFEMPILKYLVAGGPLMQHSLRSAWRWKKPIGKALNRWIIGAILCVVCALYALLWIVREPHDAGQLLAMMAILSWLAITVFVVGACGLSIARDKELGMWSNLRLCGLKSAEIARAKMLTPLISSLAYAAFFLAPLAILCLLLIAGRIESSSYAWRDVHGMMLVTPFWLLGVIQLAGWALVCSVRCRRSSIALVAACAGALVYVVALPVLIELCIGSENYEWRKSIQESLALVHPIYAFQLVGDLPQKLQNSYLTARTDLAFGAFFTHLFLAWISYLAATKAIARREG